MNARLPWAPTDHVAGQMPHTNDPLPGARLSPDGKHLLDESGTPFLEFNPANGTDVPDFSEEVAKRIAHAVLNSVSAW